jgi:chromosome partitioning protein
MPVLTVANSKGGTGKTLACSVLCARLAGNGMRVAAIDADPNRTLYEWYTQVYEGPPFECRAEPDAARLAHMIPELADAYPLLVVDTAGFGNQSATAAMASADAILIPTTTSRADVVETGKTVQLAEGLAKAARRQVPVRVLGNRIKRALVARHALSELDEAKLPRLSTTLSDVVAYVELTHTGRLPATAPASLEIASLVEELQALGWVPR